MPAVRRAAVTVSPKLAVLMFVNGLLLRLVKRFAALIPVVIHDLWQIRESERLLVAFRNASGLPEVVIGPRDPLDPCLDNGIRCLEVSP